MQNFIRPHNTFVLMGDYNISISKQNIDNKIQNYVNEIYSSGCFSLINKPTRITTTSATTLDHIYSNSLQNFSVSGILISDVSDQGRMQGGFGGSNLPPIGLSTKMHSKENITFLALLSLFFCNDTDSNMV